MIENKELSLKVSEKEEELYLRNQVLKNQMDAIKKLMGDFNKY